MPQTTSCAVQIRDLAKELVDMGHEPIVLTPSKSFAEGGTVDFIENIPIYYLTAFKIDNVSLFRRAIAEILLPFTMFLSLLRVQLSIKILMGLYGTRHQFFLDR